MKKIVVIVPCYNEEAAIPIYYNEVIKHLDKNYIWNIIFVNDGSKDNSLNIMRKLAKDDLRVKYISFSRNFGKESAMYAGLEASLKIGADAAIIMDVDLQDPPYMFKSLIEEYENGYKLIYTKHKNRKGATSPIKTFLSLAFYKVYAFVTKDKEMAKGARDFCLLDKKVIEAFLTIKDYERFTKGIYHYVGFDKKCIEFDYEQRSAGVTKWNYKKLFHYAVLGIREFSRFYEYIPKIFGLIILIFLGYDIGCGIYNLCNNIPFNQAFDSYNLRLDLFMLLIFVTLFYIVRLIYDVRKQVQNRPLYILDESNVEVSHEAK